MKQKLFYALMLATSCFTTQSFAAQTTNANAPVDNSNKSVTQLLDNPAWITLYKPTYLFPFYYTASPYYSIYQNNTPGQQGLDKMEVNFQISFKVPVWHNVINPNSTLYVAYTQLSFWQAYNSSPFFRETNYQPELFLENKLDTPIYKDWQLKFFNVGAEHQSNGRGGDLERSWNRIYVDGIFTNDNWLVSLRPWYAIPDGSLHTHNPDISRFLGYGRELISYKVANQEFTLKTRNVFESGFKRGAVQINWSFPLTKHFKGYVQWFSGYGQSLIEYNHYTNSAGIGIALNDWIR